ncbi:MAG: hypothetical protein ACK4YP_06235 [Myxococcota bacterium]
MIAHSVPPTDVTSLTLEVFLAFANLEEAWRVAAGAALDEEVAVLRERCVAEWREKVSARLDVLLPELAVALALATQEERAAATALRSRLLGPLAEAARRRPIARLLAGDPIGAAAFGMPEGHFDVTPLDVLLRDYTAAFRPSRR